MDRRLMLVEDEASGARAIASARELAPDLVIMDVVLADGVNGVEAADRIQTELGIPVLFLTAMEDHTIGSEASGSPRVVISKPYDPDALRDALLALLN